MRVSNDLMQYLEENATIDAGVDVQVVLDDCLKWDKEELRLLKECQESARTIIRRAYRTGDDLSMHAAGQLLGNMLVLWEKNANEDDNHLFARGKVRSKCAELERLQ